MEGNGHDSGSGGSRSVSVKCITLEEGSWLDIKGTHYCQSVCHVNKQTVKWAEKNKYLLMTSYILMNFANQNPQIDVQLQTKLNHPLKACKKLYEQEGILTGRQHPQNPQT